MVSNSVILAGGLLTLSVDDPLHRNYRLENPIERDFSVTNLVKAVTVILHTAQVVSGHITQRIVYQQKRPFVLPKDIETFTEEAARKLKIQLKEKIFHLQINNKKTFNISFYFSCALMVLISLQELILACGTTANLYSFLVILMPIAIFTMGELHHQNKFLQKLDESYKLEAQLEKQYEKFKECFPNNLCVFHLIVDKDITKSKISVEILNKPSWDIPKKIIAKIIQNILMTSGLTIDFVFKNKIGMFVLPEKNLSLDIQNLIKNKIIVSLDSYAHRTKFSKQIDDIVAAYAGSKFYVPEKDTDGRFIYKIYLSLPDEMKNIINVNKLKDIFSKCSVESKNNFTLLTGFEPGNELLLKKLLSDINNFIAIIAQTNLQNTHVPNAKLPKNNVKDHITETTEKKTKIEVLIQDIENEKLKNPPKPVIGHWPSGSYDSTKPNNRILPIDGGNRIPKNTFFILSKLQEQDFYSIPAAFEKVSTTVDKAHFAASRKDAEGIIFIDSTKVRDPIGNLFDAQAKIKLLGIFGDLRAYAELETAEDGKVLCVVKGYKQHAH